jgi:hypothetical protein
MPFGLSRYCSRVLSITLIGNGKRIGTNVSEASKVYPFNYNQQNLGQCRYVQVTFDSTVKTSTSITGSVKSMNCF